ncbi:cyclic nucleotide-binding domain-containing protein [Spirochaeta isovalerica]|uniref:Hemerythrin n=1 Tax=Spirochaeta isovalerica TaxID=150 RepID=A0A841R6Z0_9SPIO|nr:cyclic nucleotide-binding domain-containing protein [Spirochaeta isovalerica]MBB6478749.1 hemerythrin [Spirochaeta isovalerica]
MEKIKVATGVTWVSIPEVDMHVLCGCPMDSVKHLMRLGLIRNLSRDGQTFETGPNAILLADTQMQNGDFANVSEFPVLHMMYRQGMIIPGHPGNTGRKPMLIGLKEQIDAQSQYIFRGTYGLSTMDELMQTGLGEQQAREILRLKNRFNFNKIRKTEELLDLVVVDDKPKVLDNGVVITRKGFNLYSISYNGESVEIDLNLHKLERYEPPYTLDFHKIKREYFSVIHLGEGNGWDRNRPCMGSLLTFQGKFYLIDAGPSLQFSLTSLGISVNDIEGIFQTHGHDDHFCGLTSLVHTDHRIKYFATPLVRSSVVKKLTGLMGVNEKMFEKSFEIHDLEEGSWNYIEGLEVMPVLSPHPVETTILYFRSFWHDGYKSYGHLADIASDRVLKDFLVPDEAGSGISEALYNKVWRNYLIPADLKKIDIGGGMIHGDAQDFRDDQSRKIILSHKEGELDDTEKEIGSSASFGMQDVLIPSVANYHTIYTRDYLKALFPGVKRGDLNILQNGKISFSNVGTILVKKGETVDKLYLIISGLVEMINQKEIQNSILSSGSLIGAIYAIDGKNSEQTYRTASYVEYLEIPRELFLFVIRRNNQEENIRRLSNNRSFIRRNRLLGITCSCHTINKIADHMEFVRIKKGSSIQSYRRNGILVLHSGRISLYYKKIFVEDILIGRVCFFEDLYEDINPVFTEKVEEDSTAFLIPFAILEDIPVILWKFRKVYSHRLRIVHEKSTQNI